MRHLEAFGGFKQRSDTISFTKKIKKKLVLVVSREGIIEGKGRGGDYHSSTGEK